MHSCHHRLRADVQHERQVACRVSSHSRPFFDRCARIRHKLGPVKPGFQSPQALSPRGYTFAGAATDFTFLSLHDLLGASTFLVFAAVAAAGGLYVFRVLPETRGATLAEVQQLLGPPAAGALYAHAQHACEDV